jgi:hypothetical protein
MLAALGKPAGTAVRAPLEALWRRMREGSVDDALKTPSIACASQLAIGSEAQKTKGV